jgi:hypothetical protein
MGVQGRVKSLDPPLPPLPHTKDVCTGRTSVDRNVKSYGQVPYWLLVTHLVTMFSLFHSHPCATSMPFLSLRKRQEYLVPCEKGFRRRWVVFSLVRETYSSVRRLLALVPLEAFHGYTAGQDEILPDMLTGLVLWPGVCRRLRRRSARNRP